MKLDDLIFPHVSFNLMYYFFVSVIYCFIFQPCPYRAKSTLLSMKPMLMHFINYIACTSD